MEKWNIAGCWHLKGKFLSWRRNRYPSIYHCCFAPNILFCNHAYCNQPSSCHGIMVISNSQLKFCYIGCPLSQGEPESVQNKSPETHANLVFPPSRLLRKDPPTQRPPLSFPLPPPHPAFAPHAPPGPLAHYGLPRPAIRVQTQQPQASAFPPSFFGGHPLAQRTLHSPVLDGLDGGESLMGTVPDELKNVVRGMPPQHQPHQQPMRLNSFGEESLDSLLGDSLGTYAICAVFKFPIGTPPLQPRIGFSPWKLGIKHY